MPRKRTRSLLWNHFAHTIALDKAKCNYCSQFISFASGSLGNLSRHLKTKHPTISLSNERMAMETEEEGETITIDGEEVKTNLIDGGGSSSTTSNYQLCSGPSTILTSKSNFGEMDPQILRKFVVCETLESENISLAGLVVASSSSLSPPLLENVHEKESNASVNNYFEEVVPRYTSVTYRRHFRMNRDTMSVLIEELRKVLTSEGINVENMTVSLAKKTHITLWMLANYAVTFRECGTLFGLSAGTVHFILMQICTALSLLQERYIKWPNSRQCEEHAVEIFDETGFPGVIGSVDACHVEIKPPPRNAYDYYNRKQFHSMILQGTCDRDLKFIDIFVGTPGRVHDARVFRLSPLYRQIIVGLIPKDMHILADSAYCLHENTLTPYQDNGHLTPVQTRYNAVHSGIRSTIERAFGLLKNKFRRLRFLDMSLEAEIPKVISACCVLHNFILLHEGYEGGEDAPDDVDEVPDLIGNRPLEFGDGRNKRNTIANSREFLFN